MADASVKMLGVDAVLAKLQSVSEDVKKRGGRFALRKAAQVVAKAAAQNARAIDDPKTAADIAKNVAERWNGRLNKTTGDLGFRVGIQGGAGGRKTSEDLAGLPGKDTRHWRFIEFGTSKMAAQPFFRKALEANIQRATDVFVNEYSKALDRAIKRASKG